MATVIQISGADFSGKGFPVIAPLYGKGLIGAFRPHQSLANSLDLSPETASVSLVGAPIFHDNYIECDYANGLVTNIQETSSLTIVFVGRMEIVDGVAASFLGGTYTGGRGLSLSRGSSGYSIQTFAMNTKDNAYANVMKLIGKQDMETETLSKWGFWVASIDAINNKAVVYNVESGFTEYDGATLGVDFADRDGLGRYFHIGKPAYGTAASYKAKTHIAEALFYNRALNREEILKVQEISRKVMALKGITI